MTAVKSGLMIIDQHRADIRIRYERYLAQLESTASEQSACIVSRGDSICSFRGSSLGEDPARVECNGI